MQFIRPAFASHPLRFGRGPMRHSEEPVMMRRPGIPADVRLFATTFVAGFLFVSILIG